MKLAQPGSRDLVVGARRTEKGRMHFEWKKDYSLGAARAFTAASRIHDARGVDGVVAFSILGRRGRLGEMRLKNDRRKD